MLAIVSRAPLLIGLVGTPLAAEAVRIEVHSRAAGKNLLRCRSHPSRKPHRHRHRQGAPERQREGHAETALRQSFGHPNTVHCGWPNSEV
jgi:hypothetical protein